MSKLAVVALIGLAAAGALRTVSAQGKTQLDGVYTAEQAKRGEKLYADACSECHAENLTGDDYSPPLTGSEFAKNWDDLTLGQMFERVKVTMPMNDPGSLNEQQTADIIAFVLSKANSPAGAAELPSKVDELDAIKFVARPAK